jgi:hypothetical protein
LEKSPATRPEIVTPVAILFWENPSTVYIKILKDAEVAVDIGLVIWESCTSKVPLLIESVALPMTLVENPLSMTRAPV